MVISTRMKIPVREKVNIKVTADQASINHSIVTVKLRQCQRHLKLERFVSTAAIRKGSSRKQICSANHFGSKVSPEMRVVNNLRVDIKPWKKFITLK